MGNNNYFLHISKSILTIAFQKNTVVFCMICANYGME
jgi:hypothetical protein